MERKFYDPDKYKWGFFYFDPKDSRIFVPKNIRWLGFTVNFANPLSYLIIAAIISLIVVIEFFGL
jgi:uncharacterized membrane protein